ncbi:amino acid ABC transporter permease [Conyzicola nivalis]|uniref:Amino acid ABC transporter permease n=1 Tax=Conyzicola nivalis TaxID=1477021 RepID=A0A916SRP2_9MICO|nr:amino acid ABC transporter permease [Conyzicola nivalis]GGB14330.1 amino acid ABC transporter permease [Conyzicola nivalis]
MTQIRTVPGPAAVPELVEGPLRQAQRPAGVDFGALPVVRTKHWVRWILGVVVVFVVAQLVWTLFTNAGYGWPTVAKYFFSDAILRGLGMTLLLTVVAGAIGFAVGSLLALMRLSKSPLLNAFAWSFIWFFRSVPLLVQILVWFNLGYLYPTIGLGVPFTTDYFVEAQTVTLVSAFAAAVLGLSLNQAAYSAEIIRGGILSVDAGQLEAAAALGIPQHRRITRIILPQAARSIIPNAFNEIIGLLKGTSIISVIALAELFYVSQVIYNRNQQVIPLLLVAVLWYMILTTVLSIAQFYVERYYSRGSARVLPPTPIQRAKAWVAVQWNRLDDEPTKTGAAA